MGINTKCGAGDPGTKTGLGIHDYAFNQNMGHTAFYNSDGDFLIVPQEGNLYITTEFGKMAVGSHEICVIPRGIKFKIDIDPNVDEVDTSKQDCPKARGYICEVFESHF